MQKACTANGLTVNGTASVNPFTGGITYTPSDGFTGIDTFRYTVKDDSGSNSNEATVTVSVEPNQPPIAVDDQAVAFSGLATGLNVLANDTDSVGIIVAGSLTVTGQPANGTVAVDTFSGQIIYTANIGFVGTDIVRYTVGDNSGATSNEATVSIRVYEPLQVTPLGDSDPTILINALLAANPRLTVDLATVAYVGTPDQAGTYTGLNYQPILSLANGIILTSGSAKIAEVNDSGGETGGGAFAGDPDLTALIGGVPTFGANVLEFEFTVGADIQSVAFDFVFGSEEFPEFVGAFNDVFGVFLDGQQISFDGSGNPVTVNNNVFLLNNSGVQSTPMPTFLMHDSIRYAERFSVDGGWERNAFQAGRWMLRRLNIAAPLTAQA